MAEIMKCSNCGKPFMVSEHNLAMPGTKEKEPVNCPHCGHTNAEWTSNGWWTTSKLSPEEEVEWEKRNPR